MLSQKKQTRNIKEAADTYKIFLAQIVNQDLSLEGMLIDADKPEAMCNDRHTSFYTLLTSSTVRLTGYKCGSVCV